MAHNTKLYVIFCCVLFSPHAAALPLSLPLSFSVLACSVSFQLFFFTFARTHHFSFILTFNCECVGSFDLSYCIIFLDVLVGAVLRFRQQLLRLPCVFHNFISGLRIESAFFLLAFLRSYRAYVEQLFGRSGSFSSSSVRCLNFARFFALSAVLFCVCVCKRLSLVNFAAFFLLFVWLLFSLRSQRKKKFAVNNIFDDYDRSFRLANIRK